MNIPTQIFCVVIFIVSTPIVLFFMLMYFIAKDIKKGLSRLSGAFKKLAVKLKSLIVGVSLAE